MKNIFKFILCFEFLLACPVLPASETARIPSIAIINKSEDSTLADLLFIELVKDDKISLVEREKLDLALKEQKIASESKENNIKLGKLLKADGLITIEPVGDQFYKLKLVETNRGEIIHFSHMKTEDLKGQLKLLGARLVKLSIHPEKRKYIALSPGTQKDTRKNNLLMKFTALVGDILFNQDDIIIADRIYLPDVIQEKILAGENAKSLSVSEFVIRGQIISSHNDTNESGLEIQLQSVADNVKYTFNVILDNRTLSEKAKATALEILTLIDAEAKFEASNLNQEAKLYHTIGMADLYNKEYNRAMAHLEASFLLNDEDPALKADFAKAAFQYIAEITPYRYVNPYGKITIPNYMDLVRLLDRTFDLLFPNMIPIRDNKKPWKLICHLIELDEHYSFLGLNTPGISEEETNEVRECQRKVREFFYLYSAPEDSFIAKRAKLKLFEIAPYLFEKPEDVADLYKRNFLKPPFQPQVFNNNPFTRIDYKNEQAAEKAWIGLLDQAYKIDDVAYQFFALAAKCEYYGAFYQHRDDFSELRDQNKAKKYARELLAWLDASPRHLEWVIGNSKRDVSGTFFNPLELMDLNEQDYFCKKIMAKLIWRPEGYEQRNPFSYLERRYQRNVIEKQNPNDSIKIIELWDFFMNEIKASKPELCKNILESNKWFTDLTNQTPEYDPWCNPTSIDKKFMIFDSNLHFKDNNISRQAFFGSGNTAHLDGDILWYEWEMPLNKLAVARIDLKSRKTEIYQIEATSELKNIHTYNAVITKMGNHLCISHGKHLIAIPTISETPFLDPQESIQLKEIAVLHELPGRFPDKYNISALIPGNDFLYIGIDRPPKSGGDSGSFGGIAKWNLKTNKAELICSSKSLQPGPLNDCMPYTVLAGCQNKTGTNAYFFIQGYSRRMNTPEKDLIAGIYRYNIPTDSWDRISNREFGVIQNLNIPRNSNENIFEFPTLRKHYIFDISTESISTIRIPIPDFNDPQYGWDVILNDNTRHYKLCNTSSNYYYEDGDRGTVFRKGSGMPIVRLHSDYFRFNKISPYKNFLILIIYNCKVSPSYRSMVYLIPKDYQP